MPLSVDLSYEQNDPAAPNFSPSDHLSSDLAPSPSAPDPIPNHMTKNMAICTVIHSTYYKNAVCSFTSIRSVLACWLGVQKSIQPAEKVVPEKEAIKQV